MSRRAVHLSVGTVAACGRADVMMCLGPSAVTCNNCKRTMHMADAEIRERQRPKRATNRRRGRK